MPKKNTKRKRKEEEEDDDEDKMEVESEVESEDNEEEEDAYEEESEEEYEEKKPKKTPSKKKGQTKKTPRKTKVVTGKQKISENKTKTPKKTPGRTPSKTPKKTPQIVDIPEIIQKEDSMSLFAAIRDEAASIQVIIHDWMTRYEENQLSAISELVTLLVNASGCLKTVTEEDLSEESFEQSFIEASIDDFTKDCGEEYPIVSRNKELKTFSKNFLEFWDSLIKLTQENILFDEVMIVYLYSWMTTLSNSRIRPYRHTSTLAIYTILDSLIVVSDDYKEKIEQTEKQLKAAKKKKDKNQEKQLKTQSENQNERLVILTNKINEIFESVFVHRYKDSANHIRALCMVSLGGWIQSLPDEFLQDGCLKYIGWTLSDKDPEVRETTVSVLTKIYSKTEFHTHLVKFTKKFIPRYIELTKDVSISVSVEALKMLTLLLKNEFLEGMDKEIDTIGNLLFDENASVRQQAAKFVLQSLSSQTKGKKKKKKDLLSLEDVLSFMNKYSEEIPNVALYIVDNFFDLTTVLSDWEEMTTYLEENSDDEDCSNVISLLNASVKKLAGKLATSTSSDDKVKVKTKKLKKEDEEKQVEEMSTILCPALPKLLEKFQSDKVDELLELPQYFDLSVYVDNQIQSDFSDLLKIMKEIFWKQTDESVFYQVSKSLASFLKDETFVLKSDAETFYNEMLREMVTRFKNTVKSIQEYEDIDENDEKLSLLLNLQRLKNFNASLNFENEDLFKDLMTLLDAKRNEEDIDNQCIKNVILISISTYGWNVLNVKDKKQFVIRRKTLVDHLIGFLSLEYELAELAFFALCDIMTMEVEGLSSHPLDVSTESTEQILNFFDSAIEKQNGKDDKLLKLLFALSKAILFGSFRDDAVSHIFVHFIEHGKEISDNIKNLFAKFKEINPDGLWKYEYDALTQKFSEYLKDEDEESLTQYKNLASRFAKGHFYGKDQKHIENLVYASIEYSFTDIDANYLFLDGVKKYLSKLTPKIAESILLSYEQNLQVLKDSTTEECKSILDQFKREIKKKISKKNVGFENDQSDQEEPEDEFSISSAQKSKSSTKSKTTSSTPMKSRKKSAKRSLKLQSDDDEQSEEEEQEDHAEKKRKRDDDDDDDQTQISETQISEDLQFVQKKKKRKI